MEQPTGLVCLRPRKTTCADTGLSYDLLDGRYDLAKESQLSGRRPFSPGARQRPVKTDGYRERKPNPSPIKRPRVDSYYQEPERRPLAKPVHKMLPEPKVGNAAVIEKKPVLFNPSSASVSDYPPLVVRKPVQRQPPKSIPQKPAPVKTLPQKKEPVNTVTQKIEPVKTVPQKVEPVKTVPQKVEPVKNVPQKVEPVKTVPQKVEPMKTVPQKVEQSAQNPAVVQKQEVKPALKPQQAPKSAAENKDVQPVENKASEPESTLTAEPTPGGHCQLDPLTSDLLEHELQQIMEKVSQELPKEPGTDAEQLVVGKLSGVAGDDIKNALGLNVTKRLLNQHNPLYVKLVFSGKPEAGCLQGFIASRRISAFKRIASPGDTFAAKLDAVADFDNLCQAKEVTCGSAKVTVTPCYKFLACPPAVKTKYAIANEEAKDTSYSISSSPQKQHNVETSKVNDNEAKATKTDDKIPLQDDNQKEVDKTKACETTNVDQTKEIPLTNTQVASSLGAANITTESQSKPDEVKNSSKQLNKLEQAKKETANDVNNKTTNQNNEVNKAKCVKDNSMEDMKVVDEHIDDDTEEMTDQDILALMSSGIVLDECSGSDDEK